VLSIVPSTSCRPNGPPGSGKTTLAHELARAVGYPAVCMDEIKEGMVHATPGFVPGPGDELTMRMLPAFFGVLEPLVTTVAETDYIRRHLAFYGFRPGSLPRSSSRAMRPFALLGPGARLPGRWRGRAGGLAVVLTGEAMPDGALDAHVGALISGYGIRSVRRHASGRKGLR
jgi:hypothetical protein